MLSPGLGPSAQAGSCAGVAHDGALTRILSPTGHPLTAYGVDPANPLRMFVSDGATISRSLDGGCSWRTVYSATTIADESQLDGDLVVADKVAHIVVPAATQGRRLVYATLSPCYDAKVVSQIPGCAVLMSADDGQTWASTVSVDPGGGASGLPPVDSLSYDALVAAPSNPTTVYLLVNTPAAEQLYVTTDGANTFPTWRMRSSVAKPPLAVDPRNALSLWAGGSSGLEHSADGGATWTAVPHVSTGMSAIDVAHPAGHAATITLAYGGGGMLQSGDGGASWAPMRGAPAPVTSIAHGAHAGDLAVTTDPSGPSAGAPFVYSPAHGWSRVPGAFRQTDATADGLSPESAFFNDPNKPAAVMEYTPPFQPDAGGTNDFQGAAQLGNASGSPYSCYTGPGENDVPAPPGPVTPAPPGQGPILADNFDTGCVVSYDRNGHAHLVMQAPPYAEGVALTFDRQLIITTRFSSELTRTLLPKTEFTVLDADIPNVEGPCFDLHGNLYVEDNGHNVIYEYPYPQYPGEAREIVWAFGTSEFIEDTRIAPPHTPFAGDLLVEYHAPGSSSTDPDPNAIAVLAPSRHGWQRLTDFARLPANFTSLGMAFEPDGSVLVPDYAGSGTVLKYPPAGGTPITFASVGTDDGQYSFVKIDVTAAGYVYVSAIAGIGAGAGPDKDLQNGAPIQAGGAAGTRNAIVRFDPSGRRMLPDFTEDLSAPVGIAVPNVITGLTPMLPRPLPPALVRAQVPPGAPPAAPPPVQPLAGSVAIPAPLPAPAPGAAPAPQVQPQANPVGNAQPVPQPGLVAAHESRVQVAVAQANRPQADFQTDSQMTALPATAAGNDLPDVVYLLLAGTVLLGCAARTRHAMRVQPVRASSSRDGHPSRRPRRSRRPNRMREHR